MEWVWRSLIVGYDNRISALCFIFSVYGCLVICPIPALGRGGALYFHAVPAQIVAMSITKRYFTSLFSIRS